MQGKFVKSLALNDLYHLIGLGFKYVANWQNFTTEICGWECIRWLDTKSRNRRGSKINSICEWNFLTCFTDPMLVSAYPNLQTQKT